MHKSIVAVSAAALVLLSGCGAEEKRLEGELSLVTTRVVELEQAVAQTGMRADSLANTLTIAEQNAQRVRDSLAESREKLHAAVVKSQRTEATLQKERDAHRVVLENANNVRLTLENDVKEREAMVYSLETQLSVAVTESDRIRGQRDSVLAFVEDLKPWYEYYKKDSGRNWAKKLVGAGRAKKPTTVEPAFQPRVELNLEAERP
jgi:chromosome segregation ATPase